MFRYKVKALGFAPIVTSLMSYYLENRTYVTHINTSTSDSQRLKHAAPYGPVLEPMWFLYADDTSLFCESKDINNKIYSIKSEL